MKSLTKRLLLGIGVIAICAGLTLWHHLGLRSRILSSSRFDDTSLRPKPPAEVTFNKGAGRGDFLYVTLRLESGEDLLFMVDTGAPFTALDKSLEPKLGKRLGTSKINYSYLPEKPTAGIYNAPKLYLGDTQLLTDGTVWTDDFSRRFPGLRRRPMGVLGMDCLRHYCIQLDFDARKVRFLDPDHLKTEDLGKVIPMVFAYGRKATVGENLLGMKGADSIIDTGTTSDGLLPPKLFQQWTNHSETSAEKLSSNVSFPNGMFNGEHYPHLNLKATGRTNTIGLGFLARHLVTFNFVKQVMYLQRKHVGPLENDSDSKRVLGLTLGWWETGDEISPDNTKESLASRILAAPNLNPDLELTRAYSLWLQWSKWRSSFQSCLIPAGPPEANINVLQLLPAHYPVKVASKVFRKADGSVDGLQINLTGDPKESISAEPIEERGTIFLLHDYDSQKEFMFPWAFLLAQAGYRVVVLDLRGHGDSSGKIISYGKYETSDLSQVLDYLGKQSIRQRRVGVLGVGSGANLALNWAARDPRVATVVAIAPYNQPERAFERIASENKPPVSPEAVQGALSLIALRLGINWVDWSGETAAHKIKEPVLLIGAGKDTLCSTNDLHVLEGASMAGSKSLVLPEAIRRHVAYWFDDLAVPVTTWFEERLPAARD